jgi:hypothetical protein
LNDLSSKLDPEIAREILAIPDKYGFYSLENNYKLNWVDQAIDNLGKKNTNGGQGSLDFLIKIHACHL